MSMGSNSTKIVDSLWNSRWLRYISSLFVILVGFIIDIAWLNQMDDILKIAPDLSPMQFNTGLCFILLGVAFLFEARYMIPVIAIRSQYESLFKELADLTKAAFQDYQKQGYV